MLSVFIVLLEEFILRNKTIWGDALDANEQEWFGKPAAAEFNNVTCKEIK